MMETKDEIAIVGIGCNFPGGEGIDNFWHVLIEGRNCAEEIPPERFDIKDWYDSDSSKPSKTGTRHAAFLKEFNTFDNRFFGINDMEAEHMDPQQKLLLECSYRALEDAGVTRENISGSKTAVFVGMMNRDYTQIASRNIGDINHYDGTGQAMSIAANRISYTFNLTGPSVAIDTACSSFHYALHFALHAIKQGDCEAALCGGVNCIIEPQAFINLSKAKMISPEGISKPFSKKADGYGRGEGCGVLLLKPLKKAQEEYNRIWGVITSCAVNQNGRSVTPITRPSQQQQENLLLGIYPALVDPSTVQYVEAHGTGTPAGDSTEAESIGNVIGKKRSPNLPPLKVGSIKGNIGHTESAAGAAGVIKVLLMMHHGKIVPSLHYSESNSSIDTEKLNLSIPTTVEKWDESHEYGRVAGINCFGFGGTNAHVVVRQAKQTELLPSVHRPVELFVISAASGNSLKLTGEDTARYLNTNNSVTLPNLAYTSACRRSHLNHKYRKAFVVSSLQHLEQQLPSTVETAKAPSSKTPQIIFVFPGNGLNLKGTFGTLLKSEPVFRDKCKEIEQLFQKYSYNSILELTEREHVDLIAWEILHEILSKIKRNGSLGIISTEPKSVLCKILSLSAQEAGWKTVCTILDSNLEQCVSHCNALVFLNPLEKLPRDVLAHLPYLHDVAVLCGNHHPEYMTSLLRNSHENFQIHALSLSSIFQKASLKISQKPFSKWMKSMQQKQFKDLPSSIFQQLENSESSDNAVSSTFTCKSIPLIALKNKHDSCISDIPLCDTKRKLFKQNAVYIVTGGLTGLGFETVKFIAQNGGGCIVILSRRKPNAEMQKEICNVQNQNKQSRIVSVQCNIIFKSDVESAIKSISKTFPKCPIKGIFHSAVVFHDASIEALSRATFEEVLSAKVAGALNLHHATQGLNLDYFVCYSSVSSFLGNAMQANYAAANSFLEHFCHYRRNCGLPGQSISWGALNLGVLQNQSGIQNLLESKGIAILQVDEIHEYLKTSLTLNNPQQVVVKLNIKSLITHYFSRSSAMRSRMRTVLAEFTGSNVEPSEKTVINDLAPIKAEDYVMSLVSELSGADLSDIAMNTRLLSLGIDSMLAMTIQNRIFQDKKTDVPLVKLLDPETTVLNLASFLEEASNRTQ
ncbi:Phthiocerol synthesis polyketide synthase type I PpsA [Varanus komodoensis]|nr:Phthiocerol synthesis polyketide synthase type I PpsA [Varanus komodoensis]